MRNKKGQFIKGCVPLNKKDMRRDFTSIIIKMMEGDEKIIILTGDLGFSILEPIIEKYPNRFINCGIAECNMIGLAAGLALGGFKPFVYSNSIFLIARGYEFIRDEICFNNLNVKLCGTGAAGFLGFSHNWEKKENEEDLLKNLPNIKRFYPENEKDLKKALTSKGCAYIRL